MNYPCAKFGDCTFCRFGFIMRTNTQRHTESHTHTHTHTERERERDAANRLTPATTVGVYNNCFLISVITAALIQPCSLGEDANKQTGQVDVSGLKSHPTKYLYIRLPWT